MSSGLPVMELPWFKQEYARGLRDFDRRGLEGLRFHGMRLEDCRFRSCRGARSDWAWRR